MNQIFVTWNADAMIGNGNKVTLGFKDLMEYHEFLQLVESAHKYFSMSDSLFSVKQFLKKEEAQQDVVDKISNQYEHTLNSFELMKERVMKVVQNNLVNIEDEIGYADGIYDIHTYLPSSSNSIVIQIYTEQGLNVRWNVSEHNNEVHTRMNEEARETFLNREFATFTKEKEQMLEALRDLENTVYELNQKFSVLEKGW